MKTFTTSRGVVLEFLPIPALLEKLQAQHKLPDPPTYEVKTATGIVEHHTHDETTLESGADKAAWAEYQRDLKDKTAALNLALMRLVMLRGVKVQLPADDTWIAEQRFIGLTVPDDPLERKMHWLETEALASANDYAQMLAGVMAASGLSEEVVQQAEATFRGALGEHPVSETPSENNGHELADQSAVRANARRGPKRHPGHTGV